MFKDKQVAVYIRIGQVSVLFGHRIILKPQVGYKLEPLIVGWSARV